MQNVASNILKWLCYELAGMDCCFTNVHVCCAKLKEKLDLEKRRLARVLSSYDYWARYPKQIIPMSGLYSEMQVSTVWVSIPELVIQAFIKV